MKKITIFVLSLICVLSICIVPAGAQNYIGDLEKGDGKTENKLNSRVVYMISLDDGSVIFEKNSTVPVAPASLTKIMTALVVLDHEKDLNKIITVDGEILSSLAGTDSSTAGFKAGEQVSIYNLLCGLLIPSGNDAALVLAKTVAGSISGFVDMMNETAKRLGCQNTHFENPHGLDSPNHKTTAQDMVLITKAAMKYSSFTDITANTEFELPQTNKNEKRTIQNTNFLLNPAYETYYYPACRGIKTGNTDNAGYCLVSYASKDGYNYLAVAMGAEKKDTDGDEIEENQAFIDTIRMYDWAFENLRYEVVASEGQFICSKPLRYCLTTDAVRFVASKEVIALVPEGNDSHSVCFSCDELQDSYDANNIKKGDSCGNAGIMLAGQKIASVEMIVADDVHFSTFMYFKTLLGTSAAKVLITLIIVAVLIFAALYVLAFLRANNRLKKGRKLRIVKYNELERNTAKKKKR